MHSASEIEREVIAAASGASVVGKSVTGASTGSRRSSTNEPSPRRYNFKEEETPFKRFSQTWKDSQQRLDKVNHLLRRMTDVLDLPYEISDLATLSALPPAFLELEFHHMTQGVEELRQMRQQQQQQGTAVGEEEEGVITVPRVTEEKDSGPFQPTLLKFVPTRQKNAVAEVKSFEENKEQWGALFQFGDMSAVTQQRRLRWKPCFRAFEDSEKTLNALETFSQRSVDPSAAEHVARITKTQKDDMLSEGLGSELDEMSEFLKLWMEDIAVRLGVLLTYEKTKRNNKLHAMSHHSTQTVGSMMGDGGEAFHRPHRRRSASKIQWDKQEAAPSPAETGLSNFDSSLDWGESSGFLASTRGGGESSGFALEGWESKNKGFAAAAQRTIAAMQIQRIYRGYFTRIVTGNFRKRERTLFHAKDARIAFLWCTRVVHRHENVEEGTIGVDSPLWLMALASNLLSGKVAFDHMTKSADHRRPPHGRSFRGVGRHRKGPKEVPSLDSSNQNHTQQEQNHQQPEWVLFSEFLFQYFPDAFPDQPVDVSVSRFLRALCFYGQSDAVFALLRLLVLGDFTQSQEEVLVSCVHRLGEVQTNTSLGTLSPQFVALDLEVEHLLTPTAIRPIVKAVIGAVGIPAKELDRLLNRMYSIAARVLFKDEETGAQDQLKEIVPRYDAYQHMSAEDDDSEEGAAPERRLTHKQILLLLPLAAYDGKSHR